MVDVLRISLKNFGRPPGWWLLFCRSKSAQITPDFQKKNPPWIVQRPRLFCSCTKAAKKKGLALYSLSPLESGLSSNESSSMMSCNKGVRHSPPVLSCNLNLWFSAGLSALSWTGVAQCHQPVCVVHIHISSAFGSYTQSHRLLICCCPCFHFE